MKIIGITGGVGSGKSEILKHLSKNPAFAVREADKIAHDYLDPGSRIFPKLIEVLGEDVLASDGQIDRKKMAELIFNDSDKKAAVDSLIHPAVEEFVRQDIANTEASGKYQIYFLEAALLIECGYDKICDELWYIYADREVRKKRLKESRAYSGEKTDAIINNQLPDGIYRERCGRTIDNSASLEKSLIEIDRIISGYTS